MAVRLVRVADDLSHAAVGGKAEACCKTAV